MGEGGGSAVYTCIRNGIEQEAKISMDSMLSVPVWMMHGISSG